MYLNIISMKCYEFYGMHCYNIAGRNERECSVKEKKKKEKIIDNVNNNNTQSLEVALKKEGNESRVDII